MSKQYNFEEHIYDSNAQIKACLSCRRRECVNCAARNTTARVRGENGRMRREPCAVEALDPITNEVAHRFPSVRKASMTLNIPHTQILSCIKGDRVLSAGYMWRKSNAKDGKPKQNKK